MTIEEAQIELEEAMWIGEDGNAACKAKSKRQAFSKFKNLMRQDVGELEASEMKLEEVGIGWLHLVKDLPEEERTGDIADCEWYVSWKEKTPYKVYVYNP